MLTPTSARSQFRKAQLQAKRNAEATRQKERQLLFSSLQEGSANNSSTNTAGANRRRGGGQERQTEDEILVNASSDVTAALRRTQTLMSAELTRSRFAQETLERSNEAVSQLSESYGGIDELLAKSKGLLGTLVTSTKSDTWYLETAFYLLAGTICWLVFRRLLYGPFWWLVWFPVRSGFRILVSFLSAAGIVGGASKTSSALANTSILSGHQNSISVSQSSASHSPSEVSTMAGEGSEQKTEDPSEEGSVSQQVGQMADESRQQEQQDTVRRGDGTVLQERQADQPKNPKKRAFDVNAENVNAPSGEQQHDEL